jgi:deazaflavin-dependent oxidoreductase (nitroreductase family)
MRSGHGTVRNTTPLPEPSRFWLALMRVPTWYYRAGFGWVFGRRMLLLTHIGRRSSLPRRAVLEVMRHDPATGTYYVGSGIRRERADWVRNISKAPEVTVQVGRRRFTARAERLSLEEAQRLRCRVTCPTVPQKQVVLTGAKRTSPALISKSLETATRKGFWARACPSECVKQGGGYPRPSPRPAALRDTAKGLVLLLSRLTTLE